MTSGQKHEIWSIFFGKIQHFLIFFSLKNDQILDPDQTLSKITFFAGKRCGGVRLCPKGLIFTKIFALALTVLEIFAKNHFQKIDIFRKIFRNFSFFLARYRRFLKNFGSNFCQFFPNIFNFSWNFSKFFQNLQKNHNIFIKIFVF